jgi:hypothetical protein
MKLVSIERDTFFWLGKTYEGSVFVDNWLVRPVEWPEKKPRFDLGDIEPFSEQRRDVQPRVFRIPVYIKWLTF